MSHSPTRKRILVVEDDDPIRELVSTRLDLAGYHAVPVRSGLEALARIGQIRLDAMVLDIGLPVMDGFSLLRTLLTRSRAMPTLVLTARNSLEDVERAMGLGAWDFMAKPFDDKILITRVTRMLTIDRRPVAPSFV